MNHLLEQYEALLSYFQSTDEQSAYNRSDIKVCNQGIYLMFLSDSLPVINVFSKVMR